MKNIKSYLNLIKHIIQINCNHCVHLGCHTVLTLQTLRLSPAARNHQTAKLHENMQKRPNDCGSVALTASTIPLRAAPPCPSPPSPLPRSLALPVRFFRCVGRRFRV